MGLVPEIKYLVSCIYSDYWYADVDAALKL